MTNTSLWYNIMEWNFVFWYTPISTILNCRNSSFFTLYQTKEFQTILNCPSFSYCYINIWKYTTM